MKELDGEQIGSLAALGRGLSHKEAHARYGDAVLVAYSVKDRPGKTSIWTAIGAPYPHNTGNGLTVVLDALPVGNRIVLLEPDVSIAAGA